MSRVAISAEHLSKVYRIGRARQRHDTLRDQLVDLFRSPLRRLADGRRASRFGGADDTLTALDDVSFEVRAGEVIGIIGRNGAGKSTLLKILSRITEPTAGRAVVRGRVGSLLEVGTGFHPELTGRENISLNAAILGMKRAEIARKFDEIVAFSEVERFLDTPVKRYSSGMYVRLAFAVAAHLEPEVLLVDEVLAVGDAAFQRKCLSSMEQVGRSGRTVLFVSHNMSAVQSLCTRAIVLRAGRVALDASVDDAINEYLGYLDSTAATAFEATNPERSGNCKVRLAGGRVLDGAGRPARHLVAGQPAAFEFAYENLSRATRAEAVFTIFNHLGVAVSNFPMALTGFAVGELGSRGVFTCHVPNLPLPLGPYRVAAAVYVGGEVADLIPAALVFDVESSTFFESGKVPASQFSTCMIAHRWQHEVTHAD
jgi:lipopolysaccharide transport system ATP-binding protein